MLNLICPLCGRHVPENVFDPSNFDDVIMAVEVSGLGRGRGFAVTGRYIVTNPLILGLIGDRCHRILRNLNASDYLPPREVNALRALLEQWIAYARKLEQENEALKECDDDDYYNEDSEMTRLLQKINLEANFEFDSLAEAIEFLLEN